MRRQLAREHARPTFSELICLRLVGSRAKPWDFYGFRTRMFEDGIATFVSSAPEAIGKKAYPLLAATKAPA